MQHAAIKKGGMQATYLLRGEEPLAGLEPATYALRMRCSTD